MEDPNKPDLSAYTQANRAAWNEVMPLHQKAARQRWDEAFQQPGFGCLPLQEVEQLLRIGLPGKAVAQLCCNNGIELLSLKNLGAGECTGFDISDLAVEEANQRARLTGIDCQFVACDVYQIPEAYSGRYDLVYFTAGALGWLPDLKLLFARAARLLKPGGQVFIHEIHPFAEMLPFDSQEKTSPADLLRIVEPYFKPDPYIDYGGLDYVGGEEYTSDRPQYWFVHTLSDILMGLVENGFALQYIAESEKDISSGHRQIEQAQAGVPLSYILVAGLS
jgi:ubiquinone/menaquinone biosynthesis C-methylase UbiE